MKRCQSRSRSGSGFSVGAPRGVQVTTGNIGRRRSQVRPDRPSPHALQEAEVNAGEEGDAVTQPSPCLALPCLVLPSLGALLLPSPSARSSFPCVGKAEVSYRLGWRLTDRVAPPRVRSVPWSASVLPTGAVAEASRGSAVARLSFGVANSEHPSIRPSVASAYSTRRPRTERPRMACLYRQNAGARLFPVTSTRCQLSVRFSWPRVGVRVCGRVRVSSSIVWRGCL